MKNLFKIVRLGPVTIETCPETKPYPVRKIALKEHGRWTYNEFIGTALLNNALLDLHVGDIVAAELSFHVCKNKGHWEQEVLFDDVVKLKEVD